SRRSSDRLRREAAAWDLALGLAGLELERGRVHAVPKARRLRTIFEDVAQVRVARRADDFRAALEPAVVVDIAHVLGGDGCVEARPARTRVVFCLRVEQRCAAADASVGTRGVVVPVFAAERALRAFLARDLVLLRRELLAPFGVRFVDLV